MNTFAAVALPPTFFALALFIVLLVVNDRFVAAIFMMGVLFWLVIMILAFDVATVGRRA